MVQQPLVSEGLLKILHTLVKAKVPFMIVGNSAAVMQGAPVATIDIDLWFGDGGLEKAKRALAPLNVSVVSGFGHSIIPPQFCGPDTELLDIVCTAQGLGCFEEELEHCRWIRLGKIKVPVLALQRVVASKKAANREKDQAVIAQLESALSVLQRKGLT